MKLSTGQQQQVRTMADQMAQAGFKDSTKGKFKKRSTKQQKFAIATSSLKKRDFAKDKKTGFKD
jgi:hypothetical protein